MLTELLHNNLCLDTEKKNVSNLTFSSFPPEKQTRSIDVEEERESGEFRKCECQDDCCLVLLGSEEVEDVIREGKT